MSGSTGGRALLLDLDGTLADSLGVVRRVYEMFLLDRGRTPTAAEFESLNGPPLAEVLRRIKAAHDLPGSERDLLATYEALLDKVYLEVPPNAGATRLLARAREHGWQIGVVTSNSTVRTQSWLERTGFEQSIDMLVSSDDVLFGKPDPEPYRLALHRCRCVAANCVAVEDSEQGIRAAVGAGLYTFILGSTHGQAIPIGAELIPDLFAVSAKLWPDKRLD